MLFSRFMLKFLVFRVSLRKLRMLCVYSVEVFVGISVVRLLWLMMVMLCWIMIWLVLVSG